MTDSIFGSGWRALLMVGLSVIGIALTVRAERASESRANRLHRADRLEEAADIYVDRAAEDSTAERLQYNLGTTLLRLGSPEAGLELTTATESDDERVRGGAHYNLGCGASSRRSSSHRAATRSSTTRAKRSKRTRPCCAWIRITPMRGGISRSPKLSSWRLRPISTSAT